MARRDKPHSALSWRELAERKRTRIEVTIEVITPVFGGGVYLPQAGETVDGYAIPPGDTQPGRFREPDRITPIRPAAVRGMLRFWWRACIAHQFATIDELRGAEARLWGAASTEEEPRVAAVSLAVTMKGAADAWEPFEVFESVKSEPRDGGPAKWNPRPAHGKERLAYGAFPLQAPGSLPVSTPSGQLYLCRKEAVLSIECPQGKLDEVMLALDAWLAFGGIGGRTRRGFGAVDCKGRLVEPQKVLDRVQKIAGTPLADVPSLKGARLALRLPAAGAGGNAVAMLGDALERLRLFRQGQLQHRGVGRRNGTSRKAGRSLWPEPERIRWLTMDSKVRHEDRLVGVDKFPRADFGMPIIFQFQDKTEPEKSTLKPTGKDRLASPLILRPYRATATTYGALALVLHDPGRAAMRVELEHQTPQHAAHPRPRHGQRTYVGRPTRVDKTLSAAEATRITALAGNPDVLGAFLAFFLK